MRKYDLRTRKHQNEGFKAHAESSSGITYDANILDRATGQAYARLRFSTVDGEDTLDVNRSDLARPPANLVAKLLDRNAELCVGGDYKSANDLVRHAAAQRPRFRCEYVGQTGWQDNFSGFATRDRVASCGLRDRRLLPPRQEGRPASTSAARIRTASWVRDVAEPCCHSNIAIFMLAVGFAPPLLELLNLPSFGINLYGPSKQGKSTLLLAASSIYGARIESDLTNFATTAAALGEACRMHNGTLLPLNEVGLIRGDRKQAYKVIRPITFQLTEGREYARHSKSGYATAEDLAKYRLIFAATAEHPMSFYAAEAGQIQDDGELARCIDVPVLWDGQTSVVDRRLRYVEVGAGETVSTKVLKMIRAGCERSGGAVPILAYVRRIMNDPNAVRQEAKRLQAHFVAQAEGRHFDEVDRHRAICFGALAAAGRLACRWGFIPIDERVMFEIVRRVFRRVCRTRVRIADAMLECQERLRERLSQLPDKDSAAARHSDVEGYRDRSDAGEDLYYVHEASFKRWFEDEPAHLTWVMKWLRDRDAFVQVQARLNGDVASKSYSHTLRWPSGRQVRCIILRRRALLRKQGRR